MDNGSVPEMPDQQILPSKGRADKGGHCCGQPIALGHQDASRAGKHEIIGKDALAS